MEIFSNARGRTMSPSRASLVNEVAATWFPPTQIGWRAAKQQCSFSLAFTPTRARNCFRRMVTQWRFARGAAFRIIKTIHLQSNADTCTVDLFSFLFFSFPFFAHPTRRLLSAAHSTLVSRLRSSVPADCSGNSAVTRLPTVVDGLDVYPGLVSRLLA